MKSGGVRGAIRLPPHTPFSLPMHNWDRFYAKNEGRWERSASRNAPVSGTKPGGRGERNASPSIPGSNSKDVISRHIFPGGEGSDSPHPLPPRVGRRERSASRYAPAMKHETRGVSGAIRLTQRPPYITPHPPAKQVQGCNAECGGEGRDPPLATPPQMA
jgi:hypothetical protein